MSARVREFNRAAPRHQVNWDWRAAGNFIAGGSGGGLLLWTAVLALQGGDVRLLLGVGLALIGFGLTCVWFEIGRPWRALNTFRHGSSSWMTREAVVAVFLFASGLLSIWSGQGLLCGITGLLGLAFVYAQARILTADKGIPAWRHPRCMPLVLATGLTEGAGLLLCAGAVEPRLLPVAWLLAPLVLLRWKAWRGYLGALVKEGAPAATLAALGHLDAKFRWLGNAVPLLLSLAAGLLLALRPGSMVAPILGVIAGALAAVAGWRCKYVLICEAAYTQGFAMPRPPVRGRGAPGQGSKPGWEAAKPSTDI